MRYPIFYLTKDKNRFIIYMLIISSIYVILVVYFVNIVRNNSGCVAYGCFVGTEKEYIKFMHYTFLGGFAVFSALLGYELIKFKKRKVHDTSSAAKEINENISKVDFISIYFKNLF